MVASPFSISLRNFIATRSGKTNLSRSGGVSNYLDQNSDLAQDLFAIVFLPLKVDLSSEGTNLGAFGPKIGPTPKVAHFPSHTAPARMHLDVGSGTISTNVVSFSAQVVHT